MKKFSFISLLFSVVFLQSCARQTKQSEDQSNVIVRFPSELGMGQTWNRSLTKRVGQIVALEACRSGDTLMTLPDFHYGESPYLVAELGIEMAKGLHAYIPVTGMDRKIESDVMLRAAFERIVHESGTLTEKVYANLSDSSEAYWTRERESYEEVVMQAIRESIVLLKNEENILPVDTSKRILLCSTSTDSYTREKSSEKISRFDVVAVIWDGDAAEQRGIDTWFREICDLGKPVILILSGGRSFPLDPKMVEAASAILTAWFPEDPVGKKILSRVIRGEDYPGSRLTAAICDTDGKVLFPMGFGLNYATMTYSNLTLEPETTEKGQQVVVRFHVTNTGERTSDEVALLYVQKVGTSALSSGVPRLEAFKRTNLKPGETKEIKFTIRKRNIETIDEYMNRYVEPGEYKVMLSGEIPAQTFKIESFWKE